MKPEWVASTVQTASRSTSILLSISSRSVNTGALVPITVFAAFARNGLMSHRPTSSSASPWRARVSAPHMLVPRWPDPTMAYRVLRSVAARRAPGNAAVAATAPTVVRNSRREVIGRA
jgi:hypothetical protein